MCLLVCYSNQVKKKHNSNIKSVCKVRHSINICIHDIFAIELVNTNEARWKGARGIMK